MDGKMIGINLKIMLKYLKISLGKDLKTFGYLFIVLGFLSALSISITILLLVNINIVLKEQSNQNTVLKEQSIKNNAIEDQQISNMGGISVFNNRNDQTSLSRNSSRKLKIKHENKKNKSNLEAYNFLIDGCGIPPGLLDKKGDCSDWKHRVKNGPFGYEKDFSYPKGWTGIGLKVSSLYDKGNNDWLEKNKGIGSWYRCYHGVRTIESIKGICNDGFKRGPRQKYKNDNNKNRLTYKTTSKIGVGVYFTNDIKEAEKYTSPIYYNDNKYRVIFMCKVNPQKVRITDNRKNKEYWIVDGIELDGLYGNKKGDQVRPYRILIKKINE